MNQLLKECDLSKEEGRLKLILGLVEFKLIDNSNETLNFKDFLSEHWNKELNESLLAYNRFLITKVSPTHLDVFPLKGNN